MRLLNSIIHSFLRKLGYDVLRYNMDNFVSLRREYIMTQESIDVVLDIGANEGLYAEEIRSSGYLNRIISFEPLGEAFKILEKRCWRDVFWECLNMAIGDFNGETVINVSGRQTSSSLLKLSGRHVKAMPSSEYIAQEKVKISTLDSIFDELNLSGKQIYIKADVQGYEKHVLDGAARTLKYTKAIEIELSLTELYEGSPMYYEMIDYLKELGFCLVSIEGGFSDPYSGYLLQADGIFVRKD